MPLQSVGNCRYTPLVAGTSTVDQGASPPAPGLFSVFYGVSILALGTNANCAVNAYEVIAPTGLGTNTATVTNQLTNGTATAAGMMVTGAGPAAQGVRYQGNLVVTLSVTAGIVANALWD